MSEKHAQSLQGSRESGGLVQRQRHGDDRQRDHQLDKGKTLCTQLTSILQKIKQGMKLLAALIEKQEWRQKVLLFACLQNGGLANTLHPVQPFACELHHTF